MKGLVGIVGYSGYSGAELVRILERHPRIEPVLLDHRDPGQAVPDIRNRAPRPHLPCTADAARQAELAVVFLATAPEVSMELAPLMLDTGTRVIDLSGAFRLRTPENYAAWYKEP